ncbi:MAG: hypothetical protein JNJ42_15070 [Burkholderiaceae bacterium]|jgi:hypothetical protein|nr:hypothetical protein [Burkholderiaceae bacterium]
MSPTAKRSSIVIRCACGVAALVVTLGIVRSLDGLSNHYSAATLAKAPASIVVASAR